MFNTPYKTTSNKTNNSIFQLAWDRGKANPVKALTNPSWNQQKQRHPKEMLNVNVAEMVQPPRSHRWRNGSGSVQSAVQKCRSVMLIQTGRLPIFNAKNDRITPRLHEIVEKSYISSVPAATARKSGEKND